MINRIRLSSGIIVLFIVTTIFLTSIKAQGEDTGYRIGPGDLLEVRVFGHPELGREARVSNHGSIRLPFIDEIGAACLTETTLAERIADNYKKYLQDPQIDVFVKEYKSRPVAVIGSVITPGRFQLQKQARLLELLTFAGGPNQYAGTTIHIIRGTSPDYCDGNDSNRVAVAHHNALPALNDTAINSVNVKQLVERGDAELIPFNLKEVLSGKPDANPFINPGDVISVPETEQIYVVGSVFKPGPIAVRDKITLMQAIGMAGGFLADASRSKVRILRLKAGSNSREEFVYDIDQIKNKKTDDITLKPNDLVDVPASIAKNAARGLLGVGINMIGGLPWIIR